MAYTKPARRNDTVRDWREIVEKADADENRSLENLYPVVYKMSGARTFRDAGPEAGVYEK